MGDPPIWRNWTAPSILLRTRKRETIVSTANSEDGAALPKVFCIGLGKTGTTTFGALMHDLGYRHLVGPQKLGLALWRAGHADWLFDLVDLYDSFDDFPYPYIYAELAARYPDARFVLTMRRSAEEWLRSLEAHNQRTGPTDTFRMAYGCYETGGQDRHLVELYRRHADEARAFFGGSSRFIELCWSDADAGTRLASFLGRPGTMQVPRANAAADKDLAENVGKFIRDDRIGAAITLAERTSTIEVHRPAIDAALRKGLEDQIAARVRPLWAKRSSRVFRLLRSFGTLRR